MDYPWKQMSSEIVQLYVEDIYVTSHVDKDENTQFRFNLIARKRCDVCTNSATDGDYVVNVGGMDKKGNPLLFHSQLIGQATLDKILDVNGFEPLDDYFYQYAANHHYPLINRNDAIVFQAKVFPDTNHKGFQGLPTYKINHASIEKSQAEQFIPRNEVIWEARGATIWNKLLKLRMTGSDGIKQANDIKGSYSYRFAQYCDVKDVLDENGNFIGDKPKESEGGNAND